jgi:hypothetical protein
MMPVIELIFDRGCPHVDAARAQLREALTLAGHGPTWTEWDRTSPSSPPHAQRYGSPSVLVGGRDVVGGELLEGGAGCRIYYDATGARVPAPTAQMILAALNAAAGVS